MTMLSDLNQLSGGGEKLPTFKFKRIGDAIKGRVLSSNLVTRPDPESGKDKTSLVINVDIAQCKGGIVNESTDDEGLPKVTVTDFEAGDRVAVWLNRGFGIGAVRDALAEVGATALEDGATVTVKLVEKRDTGKKSPANVFDVKYEAPTGGVSIDEL